MTMSEKINETEFLLGLCTDNFLSGKAKKPAPDQSFFARVKRVGLSVSCNPGSPFRYYCQVCLLKWYIFDGIPV